jgi:hypothetical protein
MGAQRHLPHPLFEVPGVQERFEQVLAFELLSGVGRTESKGRTFGRSG